MTRHNPNIGHGPTRRHWLKMAGGCAALTNTSLLSTLFNLSATNSLMAQQSEVTDYKALVCLFMFGGNDSFNMLAPLDPAERADYVTARGGVAGVDPGALGLPEEPLQQNAIVDSVSGRRFGVHPAMPEVKQLYDDGRLSFVCNIGSLVQPTSMQDYQQRSGLPVGLFSHSDLQQHWMTSVPQSRSHVTGWAGRMADMINDRSNAGAQISMNISLDGVNMLQTGGSVVPYVVTTSGASEVNWYGKTWTQADIFTTLTNDYTSRSYRDLVEKTFAQANQNAIEGAVAFNDATEAISLTTTFPSTNLGQRFEMVAKTIAARGTIGHGRQVFFVSIGGWDNHDELINNHQQNLSQVGPALKAFYDATVELGVENEVLTFSASDFARTLNSNGRGSDHAWGGNQIVMGGAVRGGRLHGDYPMSLAPRNPLDLGRGRLLPTTSVDEMAAELAIWYGIENDHQLESMLPNIRNFFSSGSGSHPIGFVTS